MVTSHMYDRYERHIHVEGSQKLRPPVTSGLNSLNYENSLLLSIGKFKLDSIDRYENSCHNHLDVSFGKNGSRVKMIDTLTENIFHNLIKSARVSYFLIFLRQDSLSDTAKRWLEYE